MTPLLNLRSAHDIRVLPILLTFILTFSTMAISMPVATANGVVIDDFSASPPSPATAGTEVTLTVSVTGGGRLIPDQSYTGPFNVGLGYTTNGQIFTPAASNLVAVDLYLWGPGIKTLTVNIWDTYWWYAGSNLLGSKTQTLYVLDYPGSVVHFEFDEPVPLTPGTTYVIQLTGSYCWWRAYMGTRYGYPGGWGISGTNPSTYFDFGFVTYSRIGPEYRFSTNGGNSWSEWSSSNTFVWNTTLDDKGWHTLLAQVTDDSNTVTSNPIHYLLVPTISDAIDDINSNVDNQGIANSITSKLQNALEAYDKGSMKAFENILNALINEVEAQKGKKINTDYANTLIEWIRAWMDNPELI